MSDTTDDAIKILYRSKKNLYTNKFIKAKLTEDKDFGDEIDDRKAFHYYVLLLRLSGMPIDEKIKPVLQVFDQYSEQMKNEFSVLNAKKLRIRN